MYFLDEDTETQRDEMTSQDQVTVSGRGFTLQDPGAMILLFSLTKSFKLSNQTSFWSVASAHQFLMATVRIK